MEILKWLTEQLAHHLYIVERKFGPRDSSWDLLGVAFDDNGPHINFHFVNERKFIRIELLTVAAQQNDFDRLQYQLSHEVIHLLAPSGVSLVPMIEEGLATLYSLECGGYRDPTYVTRAIANMPETYGRAAELVRELLEHDSRAIQRLREVEPNFSAMTPELIQRIVPNVSASLAGQLCDRLVMR